MIDQEERLKKAMQRDVKERMHFQCLIGKTEATLSIMIEPDPLGDEKGTCAHFHTFIMCPKKKIVDAPEPDPLLPVQTSYPLKAERILESLKLGQGNYHLRNDQKNAWKADRLQLRDRRKREQNLCEAQGYPRT